MSRCTSYARAAGPVGPTFPRYGGTHFKFHGGNFGPNRPVPSGGGIYPSPKFDALSLSGGKKRRSKKKGGTIRKTSIMLRPQEIGTFKANVPGTGLSGGRKTKNRRRKSRKFKKRGGTTKYPLSPSAYANNRFQTVVPGFGGRKRGKKKSRKFKKRGGTTKYPLSPSAFANNRFQTVVPGFGGRKRGKKKSRKGGGTRDRWFPQLNNLVRSGVHGVDKLGTQWAGKNPSLSPAPFVQNPQPNGQVTVNTIPELYNINNSAGQVAAAIDPVSV